MVDLEIRRCDFISNKEMAQLVELQNTVYKERGLVFTINDFTQWYLNNPVGKVISFNAFDGDVMAAHYACIPTLMQIGDRTVRGIKSMATVTHPNYRGRGLFKTLAKKTYEAAREEGYEYVVGVANANSFPGFMKYFPFTFVAQLEVKVGYGHEVTINDGVLFSGIMSPDILQWRIHCGKGYSIKNQTIIGKYGKFVRTLMGIAPKNSCDSVSLPKTGFCLKPSLYVGLGALPRGVYFKVPKFVKHSPFNLIFMDLTNGMLPEINRNNVFFQLLDFDVA